jgi:HlyD family secretion protein
MNADVEIRVAERLDVVAVPTIALKTDRDIPVAASLVGMTGQQVREALSEQRGDRRQARARPADPARETTGDNAARSRPASATTRGGRPAGRDDGYQFRSRYWVFVDRNGTYAPVSVETGLTDLEYSEVISGLEVGDEVLMLPSSDLIRSQRRFQEQIRRFQGLPGMNRSRDEESE